MRHGLQDIVPSAGPLSLLVFLDEEENKTGVYFMKLNGKNSFIESLKKKTWINVLNYYLKFVSLCENIYHEKKENNRNTFNYKKQAKFSSVSYKNREGFQNFWRREGDFAGWPEYISLYMRENIR